MRRLPLRLNTAILVGEIIPQIYGSYLQILYVMGRGEKPREICKDYSDSGDEWAADVKLNCGPRTAASEYTRAECTSNCVFTTICDGKIRVFPNSSQGNRVSVFSEHGEDAVTDMLHLYDDVVASVDEDGFLIAWNAATKEKLDQFPLGEDSEDRKPDIFHSVHQLNESTLIIGCETANTYLLSDEKGRNPQLNNYRDIRQLFLRQSSRYGRIEGRCEA